MDEKDVKGHPVPCYLCEKYQGTIITKDGVKICPPCFGDLHQQPEQGEEFLRKEEKTPVIFTGARVKLSFNGKKIEGFENVKDIGWKTEGLVYSGVSGGITYPGTILPSGAFDSNCDEENDCDGCDICDPDANAYTPSTLALSWPPIVVVKSELDLAMERMAREWEEEVWANYVYKPWFSSPAFYIDNL